MEAAIGALASFPIYKQEIINWLFEISNNTNEEIQFAVGSALSIISSVYT